MTPRIDHRLLLGCVLAAGLAMPSSGSLGCKTAGRAASAVQDAAHSAHEAVADVLLPVSQEVALGEQMHKQVEQELKLHPDRDVQQYISRLGQEVVRSLPDEPEGIDFTFKVVDDPGTVNAFALPGGWIYVYSGLLRQAETEAEVVSVLAHEVAHVTERHVAERLTAAYGLQTLAALALGQSPSMLSQIAATLAGQGYLLKYGRDQEREADTTGVGYMARAGYDPDGFVDFFRKMDEGPGVPTFLLSHPPPDDRIQNVQGVIKGLKNPPDKEGRQEYQAFLQDLTGEGRAVVEEGRKNPPDKEGRQEYQAFLQDLTGEGRAVVEEDEGDARDDDARDRSRRGRIRRGK